MVYTQPCQIIHFGTGRGDSIHMHADQLKSSVTKYVMTSESQPIRRIALASAADFLEFCI